MRRAPPIVLGLLACTSSAAASETTGWIEIEASPKDASVSVDGALEPQAKTGPIPVEPGTHELSVQAEGYATYKKWVVAEAGRTVRVKVELLPLDPGLLEVPTPPPPARATSAGQVSQSAPGSPWYAEWWVWALAGVVVAGGAIAIVAVSSGGDDFVPGGELGRSSLRDWMSP